MNVPISLREFVYLAIIGGLVVYVQTKDYNEMVVQETENKPAAPVRSEVPQCPKHDPAGIPLVSSVRMQREGSEWIYHCEYGQPLKGKRT